MKEIILRVDKNDNVVGEVQRDAAHNGKGVLHRAFLALVFNKKGDKILLAKRSRFKKLWPGFWDGTVASHQKKRETLVRSVKREIEEEIGVKVKSSQIKDLFKFYYRKSFGKIGSEHEICHVLKITLSSKRKISPDNREVSAVKWLNLKKLQDDIEENPRKYTPWFLIVYNQFFKN